MMPFTASEADLLRSQSVISKPAGMNQKPVEFSPHAVAKLPISAISPQLAAKWSESLLWSVPWMHHAILYLRRLYHEFVGTASPQLLCTQKDHALVEYAIAGMDNHLFVSMYQLELPKKEDIQRFLEEKMREDIGYGG
jgi:hypothetical protein